MKKKPEVIIMDGRYTLVNIHGARSNIVVKKGFVYGANGAATGKTPHHFIKAGCFFLSDWDKLSKR